MRVVLTNIYLSLWKSNRRLNFTQLSTLRLRKALCRLYLLWSSAASQSDSLVITLVRMKGDETIKCFLFIIALFSSRWTSKVLFTVRRQATSQMFVDFSSWLRWKIISISADLMTPFNRLLESTGNVFANKVVRRCHGETFFLWEEWIGNG